MVLGGFRPAGNLKAVASDRAFVLRGDNWVELPKLPHARAAAAAAVVGDKIVVAGGQAGGELVKETDVFDGTKWSAGAGLPTPREHLAAASDGRYVYVVGGRNLSSDKNTKLIERYDPRANAVAEAPRQADRRPEGWAPSWSAAAWSRWAARARPARSAPSRRWT